MNSILREDFEYIYAQPYPWEQLQKKQVLIIGGTGLIGSLLIKFIDFLNKEKNVGIQILTIVRNAEKAKDILKGIQVKIIEEDISRSLEKLEMFPENIDYIFHCAAITKSKEMVEHPVEVFESVVVGTNQVLKLALKKKVVSMVYLSSMEAYGQPDDEHGIVTEDVAGYINPMESRSCYSLGKRMAENVCYDYFKEYQIPVKIARLAQTFGAGVLPEESRVFAQFARSVKQEENIVLHTDGSSMGNYCYTADALSGLFLLLFKGQNGEAYNIANEQLNMSIRQMAELVAEKVGEGKIHVVYDIPQENSYGYAPVVKMKLCSDKIRHLGWNTTYDMVDMYKRMMKG